MHEAASALSASQHRRGDIGGSAYSHNQTTPSAWWRPSAPAVYEGASMYSGCHGSPLAAQGLAGGAPATPMTPDDASTAGSRPPVSPLGVAHPSQDRLRPSQPHTPPVLAPPRQPWGHPRHAPWSGQLHGPALPRDASTLRERACRILRMGETLAIMRPLLYVALLRRFGTRSWLPWTMALACEAIALTLTTAANRILRKVLTQEKCSLLTP